jgi:hypothetical protein
VDPGRRAGERTGFRLTLAQVAPLGMTVAVAQARSLGHNKDDAGEWDGAETGNRRGERHGRKA